MPSMSPTSLKAILQAEKTDALGVHADKLAKERSKALDYYMGDVSEDMPSVEGRSSAVSTDVLDTVEGMMPALMEIFVSSEQVVRFEPVGEEDEEAAQQETDYVNHVFMQKNPGFLILYSFIKDALLSKVGIVKVDWDNAEKQERETYENQDDEAFALLVSNPEVEIAEHTETKSEDGNVTHDVTLVRKKEYGCAKVWPVPPEEFGISRRAKCIAESPYCYHEVTKTESELIAQGFDEAQIKSLPTKADVSEEEDNARDTVEDDAAQSEASTINRASRPILVTEHYIQMDYDGEGKPSLYRVTTGGDQSVVLTRGGKPEVVRVDCMPFAAWSPVIVTHRFFGRSIADLVMDIQRIKTALLRSQLDNAYLMNNQRVEVAESHAHERTLDDLLINRPGGVVRTKTPGGIIPIPNQPIGNVILPLIEYVDATREWRTGVTKQGQGIDANALQNQSATAVNQAFTAAQARIKLIARILAETGVKDIFSLLHGCIRKNETKAATVRLRNQWVQVDPRQWKTRDDMTINVGLGDGSRQEQVQHLMMLLGFQKEAILLPGQNIVKPKNVYNTLEKIIERIGLKTIEPYFSDPEDPENPPPPPQPSPEEKKIEADMAMKQAELQAKMAEMQGKTEIEKLQAEADIATQDRKTAAEIALAERKFELERELKMLEMQLKQAEHEMDLSFKAQNHTMDAQMKEHDFAMRSKEREEAAAEKKQETKQKATAE